MQDKRLLTKLNDARVANHLDYNEKIITSDLTVFELAKTLNQPVDLEMYNSDVKDLHTFKDVSFKSKSDKYYKFPFDYSLYRWSILGLCLQHATAEMLADSIVSHDFVQNVLRIFDSIMCYQLKITRNIYGRFPNRNLTASGSIYLYTIYDGRYYIIIKDLVLNQKVVASESEIIFSSPIAKILLIDKVILQKKHAVSFFNSIGDKFNLVQKSKKRIMNFLNSTSKKKYMTD